MVAKSEATLVHYVGEYSPVVVITDYEAILVGYFPPPFTKYASRKSVPTTYTEFYEQYSPLIRRIVFGFEGIDRNDVEDIVQTIVLEFIRGNYLDIYCPDKQTAFATARYEKELAAWREGSSTYKPQRHDGKFTSFVFEFTTRRLLGIRDRTNRRRSTMPKSVDTYFEVVDDSDSESLLVAFGMQDQEFQNIELRQLLIEAHAYLANISTPTLTRNFPELFVVSVNSSLDFDRRAYGDERGMTVSAVSMQMREMKRLLEQCGFRQSLKELAAKRKT